MATKLSALSLDPAHIKLQLGSLWRSAHPLLKQHYFFSTLVFLGILIIAVFFMNQSLSIKTDSAYRSQQLSTGISGQFDQTTISKIEKLQRSSDQPADAPAPKPGVRTNPFAE